MILNFKIFEQNFNYEDEWINTPSNYEYSIGERIKISPHSEFNCQARGNKEGNIVIKISKDSWTVKWDEGVVNHHYWRKDLLIKNPNYNSSPIAIKWYNKGKFVNEKSEYKIIESYDMINIVSPYWTEDYEDIFIEELNKRLEYLFKNKFCSLNYDGKTDENSNYIEENGKIEGIIKNIYASYDFDPMLLAIFFIIDNIEYIVDPSKKVFVYLKKERTTNPRVDPYGEEEWDDLNEKNLEKSSEYLKIHRFIPFIVRENIVPDFEMEEVEDYKKFRVPKNSDYLGVMKRILVGKKTTFSSFNYLKNISNLTTIMVRSIGFNNSGILVLVSDKREEFAVDERKEMIVEDYRRENKKMKV